MLRVLVIAAGKTPTGSQISKQEYDVRRKRKQLAAKDTMAETMITLLLVAIVTFYGCMFLSLVHVQGSSVTFSCIPLSTVYSFVHIVKDSEDVTVLISYSSLLMNTQRNRQL